MLIINVLAVVVLNSTDLPNLCIIAADLEYANNLRATIYDGQLIQNPTMLQFDFTQAQK
jgi:hypothetical protein